MKFLKYLYRLSWPLMLFSTVASTIGGFSAAALAALISRGITGAAPLSSLTIAFFGLCLLHLVAKSSAEIALLHLSQTAILRLRLTLSRRLLASPLTKLQTLGKHGLLVILTRDIDMLIHALQVLPATFGNMIIVAACLGYMAWLAWPVFLAFSACLLVCVIGYHLAEAKPLRQLAKVREQMDVLYQHFRSLIEGSKELQLNAQRGTLFVDRVIAPVALDFKRSLIRGMASYIWVTNIGAVLFYLVIGLLLFISPRWLSQPPETLTALALLLLYLVRPIGELVAVLPAFRQAGIALNKIQQLNSALAPVRSLQNTKNPFAATRPLLLELRGVCHEYHSNDADRKFMLGPLDLTILQGEILFIIGGNGSGKTTLAMLLLGLFQPEAGTLSLNGLGVTKNNLENYRQYFSAVFADFHVFEQILETRRPDISARATRYLELLGMEHKVKVENGKFSTIDLSTGQRKRLALVSSYLEDRPVYLFDEWAADQDPTFKRVFYTELLPDLKARGKTVVVITHDDAYFPYADRIVKLEDGQLRPIEVPPRDSDRRPQQVRAEHNR